MRYDQVEELVEEIVRRVQKRIELPHAAAGPTRSHCNGCFHTEICGGATAETLGPCIDHTLLKPDVTKEQLDKLCDEASRYGFATVCVNSANVGYCSERLAHTGVKPIAVVGFPLGASTSATKAYETRDAVAAGAQEIDMVINVGALKNKDYALVLADIAEVVAAAGGSPVKVIIETGLLEYDEKVIACALAKAAGAAFVKTSTGFGPGGATVDDIALMRRIVGARMGVKASGGIRSEEQARAMLSAGATRVGASSSVAIVGGSEASSSDERSGRY